MHKCSTDSAGGSAVRGTQVAVCNVQTILRRCPPRDQIEYQEPHRPLSHATGEGEFCLCVIVCMCVCVRVCACVRACV